MAPAGQSEGRTGKEGEKRRGRDGGQRRERDREREPASALEMTWGFRTLRPLHQSLPGRSLSGCDNETLRSTGAAQPAASPARLTPDAPDRCAPGPPWQQQSSLFPGVTSSCFVSWHLELSHSQAYWYFVGHLDSGIFRFNNKNSLSFPSHLALPALTVYDTIMGCGGENRIRIR